MEREPHSPDSSLSGVADEREAPFATVRLVSTVLPARVTPWRLPIEGVETCPFDRTGTVPDSARLRLAFAARFSISLWAWYMVQFTDFSRGTPSLAR